MREENISSNEPETKENRLPPLPQQPEPHATWPEIHTGPNSQEGKTIAHNDYYGEGTIKMRAKVFFKRTNP